MKNPVTLVKDLAVTLADRLAGARSALDALHATDQDLRDAHDALEAERGRLVGSRPPRAEVIATADAAVDAHAAAAAAELGPRLVDSLADSLDLAPSGEVRGVVAGSLWPALVGQDPAQLLAALAPDQLKQSLRRVLGAVEFAEGPPMAERPRLIAEVNRKIEGIVTEHAELVDNAVAVGITLAHLPITVGRRTAAAQARERWERDQVANAHYYRQHPNARPPAPEAAP